MIWTKKAKARAAVNAAHEAAHATAVEQLISWRFVHQTSFDRLGSASVAQEPAASRRTFADSCLGRS